MRKRPANVPAIILSALGVITLGFLLSFVYMSLNGKDYSSVYMQLINKGQVVNPIEKFALSSENATGETIMINTSSGEKAVIIKSSSINYTISDIEKELVNYTSIILKLYNLHNIPFTSITPKIQVYIDNNPYFMEVSNGNIIIYDGITDSPDIMIMTTSDAILSSIENADSVKSAISSGKIRIDIIANRFVLFSKGYLNLYNELSSSA